MNFKAYFSEVLISFKVQKTVYAGQTAVITTTHTGFDLQVQVQLALQFIEGVGLQLRFETQGIFVTHLHIICNTKF